MRKKIRRSLSIFLSFVIIATLPNSALPSGAIVSAASGTTYYYLDASGTTQTQNGTTDLVSTGSTTLGTSGATTWYSTTGSDNFGSTRLTVNGDVHLILLDGTTLTCGGITVAANNSLTIYAGNTTASIAGSGVLTAAAAASRAGIGGDATSAATATAGSITINGGQITATGGQGGSGIGGASSYTSPSKNTVTPIGNNGTVTINGGTVSASGGGNNSGNITGGAGIGAGALGDGGTVLIQGNANVTALAGGYGAAGIGGGGYIDNATYQSAADYTVGTGGNITIAGNAVVKATGNKSYLGGGAGIGSGGSSFQSGQSGHIIITGNASVTATGGDTYNSGGWWGYAGAGIGTGGTGNTGNLGTVSQIYIDTTGTVTATGGGPGNSSSNGVGAAIGLGACGQSNKNSGAVTLPTAPENYSAAWTAGSGTGANNQILTAAQGNQTITLTWDPPQTTGAEISQYNIYVYTNTTVSNGVVSGGGTPLYTFVIPGSGSDPAYTVSPTSLSGGTTGTNSANGFNNAPVTATITGLARNTYTFVVTAINAANASNAQAPSPNTVYSSATAAVITVPGAPTALMAAAAGISGTVNLSWTAPADDGGAAISNYEYSTDGGTTWVAVSPASTEVSYAVTGLTNGTTYNFAVRAVNEIGTGAASSPAVSATPYTTPAAPALSAAAGNQAITLTWTAPADDGGNSIEYYEVSADGGGTWTNVGNGYTYTISGLTAKQEYSYQVHGVNAAGAGVASNTASATPYTVPDAPALSAVPQDSAVTLTWTAPASDGGSAITGYLLSYVDPTSGNTIYASQNPFAAGTTTSTFSGLSNGTQYTFLVQAVNAAGNSLAGTAAATPATVPGAPANLTAAATGTSGTVNLSWNAPADNGGAAVTNYEYSADGGNTWTAVSPASTSTTYMVAAGLTDGDTYEFAVRAVNPAGSGTASNTAAATPCAPPAAPVITGITPGNGQAAVAFTPGAANGNTGITYVITAVPTSAVGNPVTVSGSGSPITVTGLTNGTTYSFSAVAVSTSAGGSSPASVPVSATPATVPGAPSITAAVAGNGTVDLTWSAPTDTGGAAVTAYQLLVSGTGYSGTYADYTTIAGSTGSTASYQVTGLNNGIEYTFTIKAVNPMGVGDPSNSMTAIPDTTPGAPQNLTATPGNNQVSLTWAVPVTDGGAAITGYVVQRSAATDFSTDITNVATTTNTVLTCTDTNVSNGTTYYYRVYAVNVDVASDGSNAVMSAIVSAVPSSVPGAPTGLTAVSGNGQVSLSWSAPVSDGGSAITGYQVVYSPADGAAQPVAAAGTSTMITGLTNGTSYTFQVCAVNADGNGAAASVTAVPSTVPGAPSVLTAAAAGTSGSVNLSWSAPADIGGAAITNYEYSLDGTTWTAMSPATTGTAYTVSGLTNGTAYQIQIRAVNVNGAGAASNTALVTPYGAPDAPTGVAAAATGVSGQVQVSFTPPANDNGSTVTGYTVMATPTAAVGSPVSVTTAASPVMVNGLFNGTSYTFVVAANSLQAGDSAFSSPPATATPSTLPGAARNLTAIGGNALAVLNWNAPADNGGSAITGYEISYVDPVTGNTVTQTVDGSTTSTAVQSLTNGKSYTFTVAAVNVNGSSTPVTSNTVIPATTPGAPVIAAAAAGNEQVTLTWAVPSDGGSSIDGYEVSDDGGMTWLNAGTSTSDTVTGLTNGTPYSFIIRAHNSVGYGANSAAVSATPYLLPDAITDLAAAAGDAQVKLSWTTPDSHGGTITGYQLSINGGVYTAIAASDAATTAYTVTNLNNGTHYTFNIEAIVAQGTSAPSNTADATPYTTPDAVLSVAAGSNAGSAIITWTPPASDGGSAITSYVITATDSSGNTITKTITGNDATSSYTLTGLTNGTAYTISVVPVNAAGASAQPGPASNAVTPAASASAPGNFTATAGSAVNTATLNWTAPANTGGGTISGYQISSDGGQTWTTLTADTTTYSLTGLAAGSTVYQLRAVTTDSDGNSLDGDPVSVTVTVPGNIAVTVGAPQTAQMGSTVSCSARVTASPANPANQSVAWSVSGGNGSSSVDANGNLTAGASETAGTVLKVTAVSQYDGQTAGSANVTISAAPNVIKVTGVSISPPGLQLQPGTAAALTATVSGVNAPQTVTWSLTVNGVIYPAGTTTPGGSSISDSGNLTVGAAETAASMTVTAASTQDASEFSMVSAVILQPVISSVTVASQTVTVGLSSSTRFTAAVAGSYFPAGSDYTKVTWSISGNTSGSTVISDQGTTADGVPYCDLTIGPDETAAAIQVVAAAAEAPGKTGAAMVTVTQPAITGITFSPSGSQAAPVTVNPGGSKQFVATPTGTNLPPDGSTSPVSWSITVNGVNYPASADPDNPDKAPDGSYITADGLFVAGTGASGSITVNGTVTRPDGSELTNSTAVNVPAPTVTSVTVNPGIASPTVTPGATYQLAAQVKGTGSFLTGVTWTVANADGSPVAAGTSINSSGLLTVALQETAAALIVTAVSAYDNTKSGKYIVNIGSTASAPAGTVTGVIITAGSSSVPMTMNPGDTRQFTAVPSGMNVDPGSSSAVTWSITEGGVTYPAGTAAPDGTVISASGVLTIGAKATANVTVNGTVNGVTSSPGTLVTVQQPVVSSIIPDPATKASLAAGVQPGTTHQLGAAVQGSGNPAGVTWSLTGPDGTVYPAGQKTPGGSYITPNGILVVGANETGNLTAVAASATDPTQSTAIPVKVDLPAVTAVISPDSPVRAGSSQQFAAVISGSNNPAAQIRWTVTGADGKPLAAGTAISPSGMLTVSGNERNSRLIITATGPDGNTTTITVSVSGILYQSEPNGAAGAWADNAIDTYTGGEVTSYRINADREKFVRLLLYGREVAASNYNVASGSTIITMTEAYQRSFPNGVYHFVAEYTDGYANLTMIVDIPDNPVQPVVPGDPGKTQGGSANAGASGNQGQMPRAGDESLPPYWSGMLLSLLIILWISNVRRKKL